MSRREGALMGVELGESFPAEQDALQSLLSDFSFHDAAIGVVSLAWSIYYFGALGKNHVNVLTLLAVAVVAGLNQEVRVCVSPRCSFVVESIQNKVENNWRKPLSALSHHGLTTSRTWREWWQCVALRWLAIHLFG